MSDSRAHDLDSFVVVSLRDWLDLHGPVQAAAGDDGREPAP